mmetsp:Transcript_81307/g.143449  ORF Transcript_81307/g.143449 Transcript_81307/m.143449 type:complete len:92 (+) Transcript_81307:3502-3777(+)
MQVTEETLNRQMPPQKLSSQSSAKVSCQGDLEEAMVKRKAEVTVQESQVSRWQHCLHHANFSFLVSLVLSLVATGSERPLLHADRPVLQPR